MRDENALGRPLFEPITTGFWIRRADRHGSVDRPAVPAVAATRPPARTGTPTARAAPEVVARRAVRREQLDVAPSRRRAAARARRGAARRARSRPRAARAGTASASRGARRGFAASASARGRAGAGAVRAPGARDVVGPAAVGGDELLRPRPPAAGARRRRAARGRARRAAPSRETPRAPARAPRGSPGRGGSSARRGRGSSRRTRPGSASASRRRSPPESTATAFSCASQPEKRKRPSRFCASGRRRPVIAHRAVEHRAALVELDLVLREVRGLDAVARAGPLPAAGARLPSIVSISVVLPEPFGPDERDVLAALDRERAPSSSRLPPASSVSPRASTTVRPLRAGFRNSKPSACARRVSSACSALASRARRRAARSGAASPAPAWPSTSCSGTARRSARAARCRRRRGRPSSRMLDAAPPARAARRATARGSRSSLPADSSSVAVVVASRNQRSCATRMTAASIVVSRSSSHSSDSTSRWFVGSSSSSRSGSPPSARPSEARVSSPPENVRSGRSRSSSREAEPAQDGGRALAPVVAARVLEPRLRRRVAAERLLAVVAGRHRLLEPPQLVLERDQVGCAGEHVLAQRAIARAGGRWSCSAIRVPFCERELAALQLGLARERAQQRRLAGAVRAREREPVAPLDLERHAVEERAPARSPCASRCDQDCHDDLRVR